MTSRTKLFLLGLIACGCVLANLIIGPSIAPMDSLAALLGVAPQATNAGVRQVLHELRLPRALAAFGVGSSLALSGVLLQALFRNVLADPYVLGVSGGAAAGALATWVGFGAGAGLLAVQGGAAMGAMLSVAVLLLLTHRTDRSGASNNVLLSGIMLASLSGALVILLMAIAPDSQLRSMVFWLSGDLAWAQTPWLSLSLAVAALCGALLLARPLNVLAAGDLRARSVGLESVVWQRGVIVTSALLTSGAVVTAGSIGFVGLIAPHTARVLLRSSDHRWVAPASALLGGALVSAADIVARSAIAPQQLPVGAVIALVGAPCFLWLLRRKYTA